MEMFDDDHPELLEGAEQTFKTRSSRTRFRIITTHIHRHRPPLCCGHIFTRPMTEAEREEYRGTFTKPATLGGKADGER